MRGIALGWVCLWLGACLPGWASERCLPCHADLVELAKTSPMAQTLAHWPVAREGKVAKEGKAVRAGYSYEIRNREGKAQYEVTDGERVERAILEWAFGTGRTGTTYLYRKGDRYFETRVSHYPRLGGLDWTLGAGTSEPKSLAEAAGHELKGQALRDCFACHATGAVLTAAMRPGVQCERCHGEGEDHRKDPRKAIRNYRGEGAFAMGEMCGECHRTAENVAAMGASGVMTVRFQPYRLFLSRCFVGDDARLACQGCHDPHRPAVMEPGKTDAACEACHTKGVQKKCAKGESAGCATCHMPKVELPGAHAAFTDHKIQR